MNEIVGVEIQPIVHNPNPQKSTPILSNEMTLSGWKLTVM